MLFLVYVFPLNRMSFLGGRGGGVPIFIGFILKRGQGLRPFEAHAYPKFTEVPPILLRAVE